ncbi:MAG TPA: glycosyltransferase, partial [Geobacteraceae bacterium]
KNLAILRRHDPPLAERVEKWQTREGIKLEKATNGEPIVKVRGCALHSTRDPGKEGRNWAEATTAEHTLSAAEPLTVLGFGLGYHLRGLAALGLSGAVIEPDMELFAAALTHLDLTEVLENFRPIVGLSGERLRRTHRDLLAGTIIPHPPALRLHPEALGGLAIYGRGLRIAREGNLRILLVNPVDGGSLPIARYCATTLKEMGNLVAVFESEQFARGMDFTGNFHFERCRTAFRSGLVTAISRGVELMAKETRPDLVIALAQAPLLPETLAALAAMGIPSAFWFVEDFRVLTYWQEMAPHYTFFFGIQKGEFEGKLAALGVNRYGYLPTAADPTIHRPLELSPEEREEFGSLLSFVGAGYHNRRFFFRGLMDYPFRIWGSDWVMAPPLDRLIQRNAARIDTETYVKIFNASAVNLNLHSSLSHEGVVPDGDFVNPRTFEIASCGAFQLVDRRSLLRELFEEEEVELFSDLPELRAKIDHYLEKPEERRRVAELGRKRVLAEHTYTARMEELLATVLAAHPPLAGKMAVRQEEKTRRHAGIDGQEGLTEFLERLPRGKAHTMGDIYAALESGEGSLSRAERIFLALKNVELKLD